MQNVGCFFITWAFPRDVQSDKGGLTRIQLPVTATTVRIRLLRPVRMLACRPSRSWRRVATPQRTASLPQCHPAYCFSSLARKRNHRHKNGCEQYWLELPTWLSSPLAREPPLQPHWRPHYRAGLVRCKIQQSSLMGTCCRISKTTTWSGL
jgi:hypothetical protein